MTRSIKFRAWDKEEKKMFPNEKRVLLVKRNFGEVWNENDNLVWMQFTGLLDKNGKEIYEGDIFPCLYAFDGCTDHVMVVEYNEPRAGFFPRWDYSKCHQKGVQKTMHDLSSLEIIGNIYENPELLK